MKSVFPVLKSKRLLLRQLQDSDTENVFMGLSNPEVIKYYGVSYDCIEATKEQMTWFANLESNGSGIWWAVRSRFDGTFLGAAGLNNLSEQNKKAEIGFWLLPDNWQQGVISETIPLILNYSFDRLGLHRIEAFVESENNNCKRVLDKLQFTHEGTMKDCEIKNGAYISLDIYSKLNAEVLPK